MRVFEPYELKMLIDAVSSSRFITAEAGETLIRKITGLTKEQNVKQSRELATLHPLASLFSDK